MRSMGSVPDCAQPIESWNPQGGSEIPVGATPNSGPRKLEAELSRGLLGRAVKAYGCR